MKSKRGREEMVSDLSPIVVLVRSVELPLS
jgi:hypothetical protein